MPDNVHRGREGRRWETRDLINTGTMISVYFITWSFLFLSASVTSTKPNNPNLGISNRQISWNTYPPDMRKFLCIPVYKGSGNSHLPFFPSRPQEISRCVFSKSHDAFFRNLPHGVRPSVVPQTSLIKRLVWRIPDINKKLVCFASDVNPTGSLLRLRR